MKRRWDRLLTALASVAALALLAGAAPETTVAPASDGETCEALVKASIAGVRVESAALVPAGHASYSVGGRVVPVEAPEVCRVTGTIEPSIRFAVWMPPSGKWNGKFAMFAEGGLAGSMDYASLAMATSRGYAAAVTNTGHDFSDLTWLKDHERLLDYAYRAVHETAVTAKVLIGRFYNTPKLTSLLEGCSNGGRQGLMEAQRFPDDFDGVISGAPALDYSGILMTHSRYHLATLLDTGAKPADLSASVLQRVHDAAIAKCDEQDGVKDGIIEDPRSCRFDPASLVCRAGNTTDCISAEQARAFQEIYDGVPGTGTKRIAGFEPGSEPNWAMFTEDPNLHPYVAAIFADLVFKDPHWNWRQIKYPRDGVRIDRTLKATLNADDPDLSRFAARGGKLIVYQGWADNMVPPRRTIAYYEDAAKLTKTDPNGFFRLFMIPGMSHCAGGPGADTFDKLALIDSWVTTGQPPQSFAASHVDQATATVTRTHRICAFPAVAKWDGTGDPNKAESYACKAP